LLVELISDSFGILAAHVVEPVEDVIHFHDSNPQTTMLVVDVEGNQPGVASEEHHFTSRHALVDWGNLVAILNLEEVHADLLKSVVEGDEVVIIDGVVADAHRKVVAVDEGTDVIVIGEFHVRVSENHPPEGPKAQLLVEGIKDTSDLAA
jgi:hypothetical protein